MIARRLVATVLCTLALTACTPRQAMTLWHGLHPNYCAEDDARWNGHDHHCLPPGQVRR